MKLNKLVEKVSKMREGAELLVGDVTITRMGGDFEKEWKVSPHGLEGDFDQSAYWVFEDELETELECLLPVESSE